jgi:hypothetical protein
MVFNYGNVSEIFFFGKIPFDTNQFGFYFGMAGKAQVTLRKIIWLK